MRVLFVDHRAELSGAERSLLELLIAIDRKRIDPVVVLPGEGPLSIALGKAKIPVRFLPLQKSFATASRGSLLRNPFAALARYRESRRAHAMLEQIVEDERAEVVVTNSQKAHVIAAVGKRLRVPLVWYFRDIHRSKILNRYLARLARKRCAAVIGNSAATLSALFGSAAVSPSSLVSRLPSSRSPKSSSRLPSAVSRLNSSGGPKSSPSLLSVVHPGVSFPPASALSRIRHEAAALRKRLGIPPRARVIVAPGQIARWKGQDVLLDAMPAIRARIPHAIAVIAGNVVFPENELAFERELHARANRSDLSGAIRFAGRIDPLWPAYAAADLVVHSAKSPEPFGRVIVEAMAAGKPVIASAMGGPTELIQDGESGSLVPPDNPSALATSVVSLLSDPRKAARLAAKARRASAAFTPSAAARKFQDVLERALPPNGPP